ncbi:MAG: OmpA family protein [Bacteroidales bacterium]|nr:OmpA family protein [Bacteroidales bacterium]
MTNLKLITYRMILLLFLFMAIGSINAQNCEVQISKKALKTYYKALDQYEKGAKREAQESMFQLTKDEPEFAQAQMSLGIFYIKKQHPSIKTARKYFEKSIALCPDSALYSYFYMGQIHYGGRDYEQAITCFEHFLKDVDLIKTDEDYYKIKNYLEYARVSDELLSNPVPFEPIKVQGISTNADEYLPIISPDHEFALFTRRSKQYVRRGLTEQLIEKEVFTYSLKNHEGFFEQGWDMDFPFNQVENEGAATLTIDNNDLYYTVCMHDPQTKYLNCDLYHSHFSNGYWTEIESLGDHINDPKSWESQPSVTSNGRVIYFASNRDGGFGGYDIYKINLGNDGKWSSPINLGDAVNTSGNEKSPFIHTDSQTLYFSSEGHKGIGGYDIFYARQDTDNTWQVPLNIGYPINSFDDDVGFFVSTDGQYGYYASNRFDENNKWNLYSFTLYEKAQPQKVLFIKGQIDIEDNIEPIKARIQLTNMRTQTITEIPVDSTTGRYVAAILFRDDQVLTVEKEGFVYSSRYLSLEDTTLIKPKEVDIQVKKIEVGESYKIDDIRFSTNLAILTDDAQRIIDEFYKFLWENPKIEVEIQGHTDDVGKDYDNLILSDKRAKAVYAYLIQKGIPAERMDANGYGETKAIADNLTAWGRAKNRRTVFVIMKK